MPTLLGKFAFSVLVLLVSTEFFVKTAIKLSKVFKLSPFLIGTTLVAIGTSLPEMVVSVTASVRGDTGLAFGNLVGSNIINILLIFAIGIVIGKLKIGTTKTQRSIFLMLGVALLFIFLISFSGLSTVLVGLILLALAITFTVLEYKWAVFGRSHEDIKNFKKIKAEKFSVIDILLIFVSTCGIFFGGIWVVAAIERISILTGYSTTILGLSMAAIATSLPELFTTIMTEAEKQEKITIGSIFGSNVYNLLLIGGIAVLLSKKIEISLFNSLWLVAASLLYLIIIHRFSGYTIPKKIGWLLLVLFVGYLVFLNYSGIIGVN